MIRPIATLALALLLPAGLAAAAGTEASGAPVHVELNKLEPTDGACRIYLVLDNQGAAYESLKLDVILFGTDGVIARRVAVETAPLRALRPTVKLFDVQDLACGSIGSLLVNDVLECQPAAAGADCLERLEMSSRAAIELMK